MSQEITAHREIRINLGNFEHVIISRTLTGIPVTTSAYEIDGMLDGLMAGDIGQAVAATGISEDSNDTSVYEWSRIVGGK